MLCRASSSRSAAAHFGENFVELAALDSVAVDFVAAAVAAGIAGSKAAYSDEADDFAEAVGCAKTDDFAKFDDFAAEIVDAAVAEVWESAPSTWHLWLQKFLPA